MHYCIDCKNCFTYIDKDRADITNAMQVAYCQIFKDKVYGRHLLCKDVREQQPHSINPYCGEEAKLWILK